jgi:hypothetical protein
MKAILPIVFGFDRNLGGVLAVLLVDPTIRVLGTKYTPGVGCLGRMRSHVATNQKNSVVCCGIDHYGNRCEKLVGAC